MATLLSLLLPDVSGCPLDHMMNGEDAVVQWECTHSFVLSFHVDNQSEKLMCGRKYAVWQWQIQWSVPISWGTDSGVQCKVVGGLGIVVRDVIVRNDAGILSC